MGFLQELIGVDSNGAFRFFFENLRDPARSEGLRKDDELLYVTSVLAHYAQTPRADTTSMPSMANLAEIFEQFLLETSTVNDSGLLEFGGSQVLLFAGFFRDQMQRRHNVAWYDQVGQSLYERAGAISSDVRRRELFGGLADSFPVWTHVCCDVSRSLRDNRFLLQIH